MSGFSKFNAAAAAVSQGSPGIQSGKSAFKPIASGFGDAVQAVKRSEHAECAQANVRTVVEDGVVTHIIVTCKCGEVIEIECSYPG